MNASKICDVPFLAPSNSTGELIFDPGLGRRVLYQSMFSAVPGRPPALVRTDFERHEYASFAQPDGRGTWKVRLLSDNKLWFGMNGPGQLACFNPKTESWEAVPTHRPSAKNSHLTDVVEGPDGRLYMPGYPSGNCVSFDRGTGEYREVPVAKRNHQLFAACVTDGGHIGILNGLQHGVYALDPRTGEVRVASAPHLTGRPDAYSSFLRLGDQFLVTLGDPEGGIEICRFSALDLRFLDAFVVKTAITSGRNLMASPDGRPFLSVDDGFIYAVDLASRTADLVCRIPHVPSRGNYYFLDEHRLLFAGHSQYYGICDIGTAELDLHRTEIENPPIGIFSVLPASSGNIYCSAHLGLCLTRVEPGMKRADVLGLTYNGSGEIYGSAEAGGNVYSISYTHNVLTAYDPKRPWRPGPEQGDNPRNLGPMGDEQYRPVTGILNGPGNRLYIGSMPDYGARGGALTVVNPEDDSHKSFRHLVPDHSILGLAVGPEHVYVGTSIIADGYIRPARGNARFLIFDPETETVLFEREIDGARSLITMGRGAGRVYFWTDDHDGGSRLFVIRLSDHDVNRVDDPLAGGRPHNRPMVADANGDLFFTHGNRIVRLDPEAAALTVAHTAGPGQNPILAAAGDGILFARGHELWRLGPG
ncbi:MAG: hypothetical protein OXU79_07670 [Gemmatimonadota bacterium]|nr:hypothetical protein [Gemmatimonadota bacterium]